MPYREQGPQSLVPIVPNQRSESSVIQPMGTAANAATCFHDLPQIASLMGSMNHHPARSGIQRNQAIDHSQACGLQDRDSHPTRHLSQRSFDPNRCSAREQANHRLHVDLIRANNRSDQIMHQPNFRIARNCPSHLLTRTTPSGRTHGTKHSEP